jgi:hypothetical protein
MKQSYYEMLVGISGGKILLYSPKCKLAWESNIKARTGFICLRTWIRLL